MMITGQALYEEYSRVVKDNDDLGNGLVSWECLLPLGQRIMNQLAEWVNRNVSTHQTIDIQKDDDQTRWTHVENKCIWFCEDSHKYHFSDEHEQLDGTPYDTLDECRAAVTAYGKSLYPPPASPVLTMAIVDAIKTMVEPVLVPVVESVVESVEHCHCNNDGECRWSECPQLRDNEPRATGRHCPLAEWSEDD